MIPLFEHFPLLKDRLPYVRLGVYPTPIKKLSRIGEKIELKHLYMKRDDVTGKIYGGNKVRKLEFILGDALRRGSKEVLTIGFAGSNHAVATAIYANRLGLKSISMLMPQHNAQYLRLNLLMSKYCDVEFHQHPNIPLVFMGTMYQLLRHRLKQGKTPYFIPPGGSSPLGTIGFINAAFELGDQVKQKEIPEPDRIYVALGTAGTAVGLVIGLKVLNMKSRIVPVRVAESKLTPLKRVHKLFEDTVSLLNAQDPSFPKIELSPNDIEIVDDYLGNDYAQFTREGMEAINLVKETEGVKLDGTYTGKTFAALIGDAEKQYLKHEVVLFWNTLNSRNFSDSVKDVDYHLLPKSFHGYFEKEVQPLDTTSSKNKT